MLICVAAKRLPLSISFQVSVLRVYSVVLFAFVMDDAIVLNVGGVRYTTSQSTLTSYPDTMLARMLTGSVPSKKDDSGAFFIDRDGLLFRHVLNFLRNDKLSLPHPFDDYESLRNEAEFYEIEPMIQALEGKGPSPDADALVQLNVSGVRYTVALTTLKKYPESDLGRMFSSIDTRPPKDDRGAYFIDGDGPLFRHILSFLRCEELILPDFFDEYESLQAEADFFQIRPMVKALEGRGSLSDGVVVEIREVRELDSNSRPCSFLLEVVAPDAFFEWLPFKPGNKEIPLVILCDLLNLCLPLYLV